MTAVQQQVLNWLYSVLTSEYLDVNRTYNDGAQTLSHYSSLSPRTDVYTYENGVSALLLHISGILPVVFRGTTYRFPIAIWVPHAYPQEAPIVYVVPTEGMMVRAAQHVDPQGKVYHPYLVGWAEYYDKSNILDFLIILRDIFAKEPPVISRQQQSAAPIQLPLPPPKPVPPPNTFRSPPPPQIPSPSTGAPVQPPPPPPKPSAHRSHISAGPSIRHGALPLPPIPQEAYDDDVHRSQGSQYRYQRSQASHQSDRPKYDPKYDEALFLAPKPQSQQALKTLPSPVSAITPVDDYHRQSNTNFYSEHRQKAPNPHQSHDQNHVRQMPLANGHFEPQLYPGQQQRDPRQETPKPQRQPKPPPPPDLLSDSLTVTLPSPVAPPVPPNPEKAALLHMLAQTLCYQRKLTTEKNTSVLTALNAQHNSLLVALHGLNTETQALTSLSGLLETNTNILHTALKSADSQIEDSKHWKEPAIDELLVAPTVVGNQLYELVCEERALADAIFVLGRAKERRRVETDTFVRVTRGLAREIFLKKVLVAKIRRGMGLIA